MDDFDLDKTLDAALDEAFAQMGVTNKQKRKKKVWPIVIVLALIVAAILLFVLPYFGILPWIIELPIENGTETETVQQNAQSTKSMEYDKSQTKIESDEDATQEPRPNVVLPGWSMLRIPADTVDIDTGIDFCNPEENKGIYNLTFELLVDVDGNGKYSSLYKSGLIQPGNRINAIKLSKPLSAGTYQAKVNMQPYDINNPQEEFKDGTVEVDLIVE